MRGVEDWGIARVISEEVGNDASGVTPNEYWQDVPPERKISHQTDATLLSLKVMDGSGTSGDIMWIVPHIGHGDTQREGSGAEAELQRVVAQVEVHWPEGGFKRFHLTPTFAPSFDDQTVRAGNGCVRAPVFMALLGVRCRTADLAVFEAAIRARLAGPADMPTTLTTLPVPELGYNNSFGEEVRVLATHRMEPGNESFYTGMHTSVASGEDFVWWKWGPEKRTVTFEWRGSKRMLIGSTNQEYRFAVFIGYQGWEGTWDQFTERVIPVGAKMRTRYEFIDQFDH